MPSDIESYIDAGVKHSWMATLSSGETIAEFTLKGEVVKLKEVDWDEVVLFGCTDINKYSEVSSLEELPYLIKFGFEQSSQPIWFHRSVGHLNLSSGRVEESPLLDFCGVETSKYKNYCCFETNGTISIHLENKGD